LEDWLGADPVSLPGDDLAAVLAGTGSVHEAASTLGLISEHVRLCCEIPGTGPPPATANGLPVSPSRAHTLDAGRLRELYEHQNLPMIEIAALASCATVTIRRLLQIDGVPQRATYRRPLESGSPGNGCSASTPSSSAASTRSPASAASAPPT